MKRFALFLLCLLFFVQPLLVSAEETVTYSSCENAEDEGYFITTLTITESRTTGTKRGTKTTTYYTADDVAIWALQLVGTFSYNYGVSATATNAQASVTLYSSRASTQICDAYTSGSAAFGYATVQYIDRLVEKELSLNCDKYGNVT